MAGWLNGKAPVSGKDPAGDCMFESCTGRSFYLALVAWWVGFIVSQGGRLKIYHNSKVEAKQSLPPVTGNRYIYALKRTFCSLTECTLTN
jgi:hypothetical protein